MARPSDTIVDSTPLTTGRVDVGARIGWLLRGHRVLAGVGLSEMSDRLAAHGVRRGVPALSGLERRGDRQGLVIDAYEASLGLGSGWLRGPIDQVCRSVPDAPTDERAGVEQPSDVASFDAVLEPLWAPGASGGEWLHAARVLADGRLWGLPTRVVEPLVDRLLREMVRSVGPAFPCRFEALCLLRTSRYADVVEDAVRGLLDQPGSDIVAANALGVLGTRPTARSTAWVAGLLTDPSVWVVAGASYALQQVRVADTAREVDWSVVVEPFLAAHSRCAPGSSVSLRLTRLLKSLPASARAEVVAGLTRPPDAVGGPASWTADEDNAHWAACVAVADDAVARTGGPAQPMLARLVFEAAFDFRETVAEAGSKTLMASPYVAATSAVLLELADATDDPAVRDGAIRAVHFSQVPVAEEDLVAWVSTSDLASSPGAYVVAANAGAPVPVQARARVLEGGETALRVVEWMGMSHDPGLAELADCTRVDAEVRAAAAWWAAHPGRVVR
ncbi:MAG: hypothetical protein CMH83_12755 [Nocardioides sp.]|nr:hypothetical protein [Nocardioides sp.]